MSQGRQQSHLPWWSHLPCSAGHSREMDLIQNAKETQMWEHHGLTDVLCMRGDHGA